MRKLVLSVTAAFAILACPVTALTPLEEEIALRLKPAGELCLKGDPCEAATGVVVTSATTSGIGNPKDTYNQACIACHASGVAGAPRFGNTEDWAPRLAKGRDQLYASVINGMPPAMPAKGTCFSCSEEELRAVTDYMIAEVE